MIVLLSLSSNKISKVKVTVFEEVVYETDKDANNQPIIGTGPRKIIIPVTTEFFNILAKGIEYKNVKITLVFSLTGDETTSDSFKVSF